MNRRAFLFGATAGALVLPRRVSAWQKYATNILPPGLYYWEWTLVDGGVGASAGWGVAVGVANASMVLTETVNAGLNLPQANSEFSNFVTVQNDGAGAGAPGWGYPLRPTALTHNAVANGQVYSVAVNTITHLLWERAATGADTRWNVDGSADPATGTGGIDISATGNSPVLGNLFPICGADMGDLPLNNFVHPGVGTVNFGASAFAATAPTGAIAPFTRYPLAALSATDKSARITLSGGNLGFTNNFNPGGGAGDKYSMARANFSIAQS